MASRVWRATSERSSAVSPSGVASAQCDDTSASAVMRSGRNAVMEMRWGEEK